MIIGPKNLDEICFIQILFELFAALWAYNNGLYVNIVRYKCNFYLKQTHNAIQSYDEFDR